MCFKSKDTIDFVPDGPDGLHGIQRAILRYCLRLRKYLRCSGVLKAVIEDPDCPRHVRWWQVDAALQLMTYGELCHEPLLEPVGAGIPPDGAPAAGVYRGVGPTPALLGFAIDPPDAGSLWDPAPLRTRWPFALAHGCGKWEILLDDTGESLEQTSVQVRCLEVHCLQIPAATFLAPGPLGREADRYLEPIEQAGVMIGLSPNWRWRRRMEPSPEGFVDLRRGGLFLPHGRLRGLELRTNSKGPTVAAVGGPSLALEHGESGKLLVRLRQSACGRVSCEEIGEGLATGALQPTADAARFVLQDESGEWLRSCDRTVRIRPLARETFRMLAGERWAG